ncbi:sugar kinase [uncultured Photobacterium sp.]|uniref:sugar kinase n=1 Tax=uncultured Photobacterium sp. TaxID=173973 RepID=UPI0026250CE8|nr:sugar kinase [uncultured Photobacterium sp.]
MKIAFFGECMIELSGQPLQRTFGGDTLNTALYLSRLGGSRELVVSYATALGIDKISHDMMESWQAEQIDTQMVRKLENKLPGLYLVETEPNGERHIHYWRNDSAAKFYFSADYSPLEQAIDENRIDGLYISGISLAILAEESKAILITLLEKHKKNGGKLFFYNNFRSQLWTSKQAQYWYSQVLPFADIALSSEEDDRLVWGDIDVVEHYRQLGCHEVVVRQGRESCKVATRLQTLQPDYFYVVANQPERVVDPCAIGDAFAAGYLASRLDGGTGSAAAELGHQLASIVIQHPGAIIPSGAMKELM